MAGGVPVPSFLVAPIATRVPSEDIDTEHPEKSPAASPSMSAPTWVHVPPLSAYTRTWPASCRRRRSYMRRSPRACRPRTSIPSTRSSRPQPRRRCRRPPGSTSRRSRRTPARGRRRAGAVVPYAPIATRVPSEDIDTDHPDCLPQPRRRCRRPPGSTSRRSRRTPARGRRCRRLPSLYSADRHARAVRGHRYRDPGLVSRSLAVDVGAHLGPRPAALGVHAHVPGSVAGAVVI